jgi:beta-lactamase superfamily II metal-dependent hydrolase
VSVVKSFAVGYGDMFFIDHNSDNFTIIDCKLSDDTRKRILKEIRERSKARGITRFVSTHPDDDHICGLVDLDDQLGLLNFYCVENAAIKIDETDDFDRYCSLRDSSKAFKIFAGCSRRWMNLSNEERQTSGIEILWPKTANAHYQDALDDAAFGLSPNNISAIIKYSVTDGPTFLWMGDLETEFMENIQDEVDWPKVDVLFAPHHGRASGAVPTYILEQLTPKLVVIGEAPSEDLNYYPTCDTITQNSAGDISFDCVTGYAHIYVSSATYSSDCLEDLLMSDSDLGFYIGSLNVSV